MQRRVYNGKGLNHFWHINTKPKLVRWNFVMIGGTDGYGRLPVMLEWTDSAVTVLASFVGAVDVRGPQ